MSIRILAEPITRAELQEIANERYGDLVKVVVDVEQGILALGPEMHADAQTLLIDTKSSSNEHTWGINLYPAAAGDGFVEYDSLVNLKPAFGNRTRGVENEEVRKRILEIVRAHIKDANI